MIESERRLGSGLPAHLKFADYKNHVNADAEHKLIQRYDVTDAAVHDSQTLAALSDKGQYLGRRVRRQRLSVNRNRGGASRARL